ncbi:MAG: hypothetical protein KJO32_13795 [Deltaproteobacteria bacterium]|nr:hypothetical protein [Deltaproteobacteria bacterium]
MRFFFFQVILSCIFFTALATAQQRDYFLPKPAVQKYVVILTGAAVEEQYAEHINTWSLLLHDILTREYHYGSEQISLLMEQADLDDERISGSSRGEIIKDKLRDLKDVLNPGDQVFIFLLGHGTSNEDESKFVITGPDITAQELAAILEIFSEQDIVLVNATSSSYPFCKLLSGPGRVIVSATRSKAEKYNTIFAQFFIAALGGHAGDRDKNRRVSIWEAFRFANSNVERWYADQSRIPTEHAVLDDNGDGVFTADPDPLKDDGRLAQIAYLDLIPAKLSDDEKSTAADITIIRDLTAKMRELERSVFLLRNRKAELPQESYQKEMEVLLIDLARISRKLNNMITAPGE